MLRRSLVATALVGALAAAAQAAEPYAGLLEKKADAVVAVKYVLHVSIPGRGEQEGTGSGFGVLVDPSGLVVMQNPSRLRGMGAMMRSSDLKIVPSEFRVMFPGDPKEYAAVLGATDTKIGLTFVQIKDLEGREVHPLDVTKVSDPQVGDLLYGVSRLPQGFDYAPYCSDSRVTGKIMKPREMWNFEGDFDVTGHPLYTADGSIAGMIVEQEGTGGGTGSFLLPWKTFASTLERAKKASKEALEEALKRDAEGGDAPKEGAPEGETPKEEAPKEESPKEEPPGEAPKEEAPGSPPGGSR